MAGGGGGGTLVVDRVGACSARRTVSVASRGNLGGLSFAADEEDDDNDGDA